MSLVKNKNTHSSNLAFAFIEWLTGLSYTTLFTVWLLMAVGFGAAYFGMSYVGESTHSPTDLAEIADPFYRFANAMYYSIITATSTGYGDITPQGISKLFAAVQSITALLVFAIFVTKLVSHQQELTLTEVHRLTFEDVFHNTREGFYICRKDFDHAIAHAEKNGTIDFEHWENIVIAYRHLQTLFEEIPDFYANDMHNYTIDIKREQLLAESAHRTLHRINVMLDTFSSKDIEWATHERSMKELQELVNVISTITPLWEERSPYDLMESFADILQMKERMHLKIMQNIN
ncbi:hypothetical protein HOL63_00785 [Candidatus Peregrinibacteria bacterium]|jgi:hypothetical protein|nr:hypothetical protein [Candidatus Peregrinibacteria bacterium]MBT5468480.1 hypothetical protein [Candidatus Peregrinibacteria bacterium]MBT7337838.1 hypothetical protein [Candidatus Peregrinibacteria bacterium]